MEIEMAKAGRSLLNLATEIQRRAEAKQDFIAPVDRFRVAVANDVPVLTLDGQGIYEINDSAHGQIAEYAGIPLAYYRRMATDDPTLLAENVNRWLRDKFGPKGQQRRMVRTLDGRCRAFLSDGYRTLENEDLAEVILPVLNEMELDIISCEITETRMYLKAVDRAMQRDIPTGKFMGDGGHTIFDTCSPAIVICNSETGHGTFSVEAGVWTKACTNMAVFESKMRKYHTGRRADVSDEVYAMLTDETKRQTDQAIWMQARDLVRGAFDEAKFEAIAKRLGQAAQEAIPASGAIEVIERVGRRFSLTEGERKGVLDALIEGADLSRYGLHAAVTRYSQHDDVGYDRATELERIGGQIIETADALA
jgi:hypothetical protein